jgi:hypothetical protein
MANLILPDTFEPYYAGREDEAERRSKPPRQSKKQQSKKQPQRSAEGEIVLPQEAPAPAGQQRRDRRPVAH